MQSTSHRALLILDLQKEFLHPPTGRCLLPSASADASQQPRFISNIQALLPRFRALGGDVIWMRSESRARRDHTEETIKIVNESDSEESASEDSISSSGDALPGRVKVRAKFLKGGKIGELGPSRPPLLTDAYLSIDTSHPPVSKGTPASEWHEVARSMMSIPPDREMTKSWYSAFKDTELLQTLRGRIVTQLVIVGLMTNVDVLATAADAVRHGLEVWVVEDCLGYRNETAHEEALKDMQSDFAVEKTNSQVLMKAWEKEKSRRDRAINAGNKGMMGLGATGMSKEELSKVVEGLRSNIKPSIPEPDDDPGNQWPASNVTQRVGPLPSSRAREATLVQPAEPEKRVERTLSRPTIRQRAREVSLVHPAESETQVEKTLSTPTIRQRVREAALVHPAEPEKQVERTLSTPTIRQRAREVSLVHPAESETQVERTLPTPTIRQRVRTERRPRKFESTAPLLGEGDKLGTGDSFIVYNILPIEQAQTIFDKIKKEVQWRSMFHRGGEVPRLVAVEGEVRQDGSFPIYRHPADESPPLLPFSPTVNLIREEVQKVLKHPINHVLIQHYRDGSDYISEHSDKTLDIARGSKIVNVSLGAQRTMILRMKKDPPQQPHSEEKRIETTEVASTPEDPGARRDMQRIPMPHNSMLVLGLETNQRWLHGIRQDKRAANIKSPVELAHNGERISLTFRHIATWLSSDEQRIYGQGAPAKTAGDAHPVINGDSASTEKLLAAFGAENHRSDFDWDTYYGPGFDVLHFQEPKPRILTSGTLDIPTARIKICLHEKKVNFVEQVILPQQMQSLRTYSVRGKTPILIDTDRERTAMSDSLAILQYLEMFYTPSPSEGPWLLPSPLEERAKYAQALTRLQEADKLFDVCLRGVKEEIESELRIWGAYLQQSSYAAGDEFSLVDVAIYPVFEKIRLDGQSLSGELVEYMSILAERESMRSTYNRVGTERVQAAEDQIAHIKTQSEMTGSQSTTGDGVAELEWGLKEVTLNEDD
ncbi:hypothetical protein K440DRAFT_657449 [Wilcoxina mikolae CBS 423.85]|nr:hypothetical protein K440DRAFT_657449 [Wilcoxina mikolae CBS 423.85]